MVPPVGKQDGTERSQLWIVKEASHAWLLTEQIVGSQRASEGGRVPSVEALNRKYKGKLTNVRELPVRETILKALAHL